ncbi:basic amino acid ABC transporter substrate-binding protein [Candidatus Halobonum tyrrellensis]|uniref:Amino acid ABC transporter amino acid-binding protein n=1 Tax=Candidatus Halobonum tyrrellensis G22 TaxID=1324957 RepID=V4HQG0_9EURY|nr:basic amino acid ABC transporter substrate-binding protein [Candidatus Halobonum tyrrellensis]ESP90154.1 amino acid ABC transporter amino acid-binding protein [Candidatus Halobonum tyrrellensis G22]
MDRRTYLRSVGGSAVALTLAGCSGDGGEASPPAEETTDDSAGGETGTGTETGTESGGDGEVTTVTPGTAPGFPPFEMMESGELVGFDVDLLSAVVAEADGYELGEWQTFDFDSLIPALTSDNIDVIAAALTINDDRDQTIDFSDPYYNADQAVLVRTDGDFAPSDLEALSGHPVGAQSGTTGETVAQENVEGTNYNSYDSYVFAVQDLENGNIDAVVLDVPVARTFAQQRPVEVAFVVETGERYGFGIREGASELQTGLNQGLQAVRDSGQYEEVRNEWFGGSAESTGTADSATANSTTTGTSE